MIMMMIIYIYICVCVIAMLVCAYVMTTKMCRVHAKDDDVMKMLMKMCVHDDEGDLWMCFYGIVLGMMMFLYEHHHGG